MRWWRMVGDRSDRVLDLDGPAGGHHRGGEDRRDVTRAGGEDADRGDRAARAGGTAGGRGAAAGGRATASSAAESEQLGQDAQRSERGQQGGELPARAAQVPAELATAGAIAQVAAGHPVRPDAAVVGEDQVIADLRAGRVACLGRLRQPDARAHQQRLHRRYRDRERVGDLERSSSPPAPASAAPSAAGRAVAGRRRSGAAGPRAARPRRSGRAAAARTSSISSGPGGAGRRSSSMHRLCAIRYSHARSASSRSFARSPPNARTNTSWRASSASWREPGSICRVYANSRCR